MVRDLLGGLLAGARDIWERSPVRILYLIGIAANLAYEQLSAGIAVEDVLVAVVVALGGELLRKTVTSPATAKRLAA